MKLTVVSETQPEPVDDPLAQRVRDLLDDRAAAVAPGVAPVAEIHGRARRRVARHRRLAAVAAVGIVVSGGVVWFGSDRRGQELEVGALGSGDFAELDWRMVDPFDVGGESGTVRTDDGRVYRLGTMPVGSGTVVAGEVGATAEPPAQELLVSDDGEWKPAAAMDGYTLTGLAARGNDLYAVGTAATTRTPDRTTVPVGNDQSLIRRRPGTAVVRRSSDGGASWDDVELPVDLEALFDEGAATLPTFSIASSNDALVVAVAVNPIVSPESIESLPHAPLEHYWATNPDGTGFELWGPPADIASAAADACPTGWRKGAAFVTGVNETDMIRCPSPSGGEPIEVSVPSVVVDSRTWDQLGIAAPSRPERRLFRSEDGSRWQEIEVPWDDVVASAVQTTSIQVGPDGTGGFVVAGFDWTASTESLSNSVGAARVAVSADGVNWSDETPEALGDIASVAGISLLDGRPVVTAFTPEGAPLLIVRSSAGTWTRIEPAGVASQLLGMDGLARPDVMVLRVDGAAAMLTNAEVAVGRSIEVDGYRVSSVDISDAVTVTDPQGTELGTVALGSQSFSGRLLGEWIGDTPRVKVFDEAGRDVIADLDLRELVRPSDDPRSFVVWSPDGRRWGLSDLSKVTDMAPTGRLSVSSDKIAVEVAAGVADEGGTDSAGGSSTTGPGTPVVRWLVADLPS